MGEIEKEMNNIIAIILGVFIIIWAVGGFISLSESDLDINTISFNKKWVWVIFISGPIIWIFISGPIIWLVFICAGISKIFGVLINLVK